MHPPSGGCKRCCQPQVSLLVQTTTRSGDSVHIPQQFAFPDRTDFLQWLSLSIQVHREVSHGILTGSRERLGCLGCQKLGEGIIGKGPEGERLNFETPGSSVSVNCFDPEESRQLGDY